MTNEIRKTVGKAKDEGPLVTLARINRGLKKLGCKSDDSEKSSTVYRKIVGVGVSK